MAHITVAAKANHALVLPILLAAAFVNKRTDDTSKHISTTCEDVAYIGPKDEYVSLSLQDGTILYGQDAFEHLRANFPPLDMGHGDEVTEWIVRSRDLTTLDFKSIKEPFAELEQHLRLRSFVVGYSMTLADLVVWGIIRGNRVLASTVKRTGGTVSRWFGFINAMNPWIEGVVLQLNAPAHQKRVTDSAAGASYQIGLDASGIVTRFPPEPSGYLHIGHAKAALLNDHFAHKQPGGTLICRFDDTNPSKEKIEFQESILHDLRLIGVVPDKISYSSDYFQVMYELCVKLITDGNAYADDTEKEIMKLQRRDGLPSENRNMTVDETLRHLDEMKRGSSERWCIRARISVDNPNKAMRDPVIYRCNSQPHHRTKTEWKIYPTYDFCAPILDSIEHITYALRTNEYRDRNAQYAWVQQALSLPEVEIYDFSRMNFRRTVLSKRKLSALVEKKVVYGWDDPRMPTIRGLIRRGLTVEALREFVLKQGPSRNILLLDSSTLWAINKKIIDFSSPRFTAVDRKDVVACAVIGGPADFTTSIKPRHRKNASLGTKKVVCGKEIYVEQEDARQFALGEEITLMNWGNAFVQDIVKDAQGKISTLNLKLHLEGDFKKTDKKITWLSTNQDLVPARLVDFDDLITKDKIEKDEDISNFLTPQTEFHTDAWADCNVVELHEGDMIQFERKGYYRVDQPFRNGSHAVLFAIPMGKKT